MRRKKDRKIGGKTRSSGAAWYSTAPIAMNMKENQATMPTNGAITTQAVKNPSRILIGLLILISSSFKTDNLGGT
jgi:hypothetical protein